MVRMMSEWMWGLGNHGDADCDAGVCCAVTGKKLAGAKESVAAG